MTKIDNFDHARAIVDDDGVWAYDPINEQDVVVDTTEHDEGAEVVAVASFSGEAIKDPTEAYTAISPACKAILEKYADEVEEPIAPMTNEELKDFLMNGRSLMEILDYGYTSESFADPVMKGLWEQLTDEYVKVGECVDKVEEFLRGQ